MEVIRLPRRSSTYWSDRLLNDVIRWTAEGAAQELFKTYQNTFKGPTEADIEEAFFTAQRYSGVVFQDDDGKCKQLAYELFLSLKSHATGKLSDLQKQILIKAMEEQDKSTGRAKWRPKDWFGEPDESQAESKRVAWSRALQRLEKRYLIRRYPHNQDTTHIGLTDLGTNVTKRLRK